MLPGSRRSEGGPLSCFLPLFSWLRAGAGCSPRRASHFCLRAKVTKKRLECGGTRQNSAARRRRSVRTTAASQWFHKRKVRHIASLVPVNLATSRDMVRESRADFDFVSVGLGSRMLERACEAKRAVELVATTPRQPLRRDAKAQTVFPYGKASQQSMRGCIGAPKRLTNRSRTRLRTRPKTNKPRIQKKRGLFRVRTKDYQFAAAWDSSMQ